MLTVSPIAGWFRHGSCTDIAGATLRIVLRLNLQEPLRDSATGATWDCQGGKVSEMQHSFEAAKVAQTIVALRERLETVRQTELERMRRRAVKFRSEQQGAIEELTRGIVTTILHGPATVLETASTEQETAALLRVVHCIFNLGCD